MKKITNILLLSFVLSLSLLVGGCTNEKTPTVTNTASSTQSEFLQNLSTKTGPQDDFYEYVNENILKDKKIDEDNPSWDNFNDTSNKISEELNEIIENLVKDEKNYSPDSSEKAIVNLYKTALDKKAREEVNLGSLQSYIDKINSANSISAYLEAIASIQSDLNYSSLLSVFPKPDSKDSSIYSLSIEEPVLISTKEILEVEDNHEALKKYMTSLLLSYGMESTSAEKWGEKLLDFQKDLSLSVYSKKDNNNIKKTLNYLTLEDIQEKLPNVELSKYLDQSNRSGYSAYLVLNPSILPVINKYLVNENLELLKTYSTVILLNDYAPYLKSTFSVSKAEFDQESTDEKDMALKTVNSLAEKELGQLYAKEYFSPEKREAATKMVKEIIAAYRKNLENLDWLSPQSKAEAIKKVDNFTLKIGYSDSVDSILKNGISKSPEDGGNFIDNVISLHKVLAAKENKKASLPVDRNEENITPQTLNAFYDHANNEIALPAAILQPPFYDENATTAQNLGTVGAIIGHEITHAFDDNGSYYDEKGNLRDWWTVEDRNTFNTRAKSAIEHFSSYEVLPGFKVDGELTLGENIADLGGVSVITSLVKDDKNALKEMYLSYARIWAIKQTEDMLKNQLVDDEHAPEKIRVNGVLSNTDTFYEIFEIKPGDKMYIAPEKRIRMY